MTPSSIYPPSLYFFSASHFPFWLLTGIYILVLLQHSQISILKFNSDKTEVLVDTKSTLAKPDLTVENSTVLPSPKVISLGVILDITLSFEAHINNITQSAYFNLRNINHLSPSLAPNSTSIFIHTFIRFCIDYCNSIHFGLLLKCPYKLQLVQILPVSPELPP